MILNNYIWNEYYFGKVSYEYLMFEVSLTLNYVVITQFYLCVSLSIKITYELLFILKFRKLITVDFWSLYVNIS